MNTTRRLAATLSTLAIAASCPALGTSGPALASPISGANVARQPAVTTATPGPGWTVITMGPTAKPAAAQQMVLVSPTGKQQVVARVSSRAAVVDVSNDGRRVLYVDVVNQKTVYRVFDLRTRRASVVGGPASDAAHVRFTQPSGTALLVRTMDQGVPNTGWIKRTTLTGTVKATYARTANANYMSPSPDGLFLVSQNSRAQLQVNGNGGAFVRTLANPAGYRMCSAQHWTSTRQFTAVCMSSRAPYSAQVFRYDLRGGKPVLLTGKLPIKGVAHELGYQDLWGTPKGQVVARVSGCGTPALARVNGTRLSSLPVGGQGSGALAVTGTRIPYWTGDGCEGGMRDLRSHDLATGRSTVLAGGTVNRGQQVRSAVALDRMR